MASDGELLRAWQAGDAKAASALIDRYSQRIFAFFSTRLEQGVEDLCQRTFEACVQAKAKIEDDGAARSFRSYLFGVARRQLLKAYRDRSTGRDGCDPLTRSVAELSPGASTVAAAHEEEALVAAAMKRLPIDYQIALELHYWEGMTTAEIAAVLEIPRATAKTRLLRGRERLKASLAEVTEAEDADLLGRTDALARRLGRR